MHYIYSVSFFRENGDPFTILCTSFDRCIECARMVKKDFSQIPNVFAWKSSSSTPGGFSVAIHKSDLLKKYVLNHIEDAYSFETL